MARNSLRFPCCFSHSSPKLPLITGKSFPPSSKAQMHSDITFFLPILLMLIFFCDSSLQKQAWSRNSVVFWHAFCLQLPNLDKISNVKSMGCSCSKPCVYFSLGWKVTVAGENSFCDAFLSAPCLLQAQTMCNFITLCFSFANFLTNWCLKLTLSRNMGFGGGFGGVSSET